MLIFVPGIAKGLRSAFKTYASAVLPVVLEKFKEKKANVVSALDEASKFDLGYPYSFMQQVSGGG